LSGNYAFHLMAYRRELLLELGGLRPQFDGSQDYDLLLRAAETHPVVRHIPAVLYHWRQHTASVAHSDDAKSYAFAAGHKALQDALTRRGLNAQAVEIDDLWRGMYRLQWPPIADEAITVITQPTQPEFYGHSLAALNLQTPYLAILADGLHPLQPEALAGLCAWLQVPGVALVSGKIIDAQQRLVYAGMHYQDGQPVTPYQSEPETEAGYMALTRIAHNCSAPHPYCVVLRREVWQQLGGLDNRFQGPYGLLDLALRAQHAGWRCLVDPQFRWQIPAALPLDAGDDAQHLRQRLVRPDGYGNPHTQVTDQGIRLREAVLPRPC
ncbi:MAG: hypothetical protein RQ715_10685, partial [Methylococcales bacterium]|nr:hypothetical protein [Methylococcales bacterium]